MPSHRIVFSGVCPSTTTNATSPERVHARVGGQLVVVIVSFLPLGGRMERFVCSGRVDFLVL